MPWAAGRQRGVEQQLEYIRRSLAQLAEDDGFQAAIFDGGAIVGSIGFHRIDWTNRATSLGYWLAETSQGRGTLSQRCFDVPNRCRIQWPQPVREEFFE